MENKNLILFSSLMNLRKFWTFGGLENVEYGIIKLFCENHERMQKTEEDESKTSY